MNNIRIFCLDNSELMDFNSINRGYRGDIYVEFKKNYYNLNFYDNIRLQQDFEKEMEDYGIFSPEPNIIVIKEVSKDCIRESIENLKKIKYFDQIKSIPNDKIKELTLLI